MNQFQEIFDKQKAYFDSDATKSYEWRIDQLTRLENLCNENAEALEAAMSSDFKTASQEKVFEIMAPVGTVAFAKQDLKEWMKPIDVVVPKALRESGHTAKVYREPYGVTLVIGPFNGPLTLLFDPAVQVIAAGNPCILKLSEGLPATSKVLLDLIPKYFDPRSVTAVTGSKDEVTELLKLPFDFIFFTGSVKVGKIVMEAAAKNLTPVLLELGGQNPAFVDATANIPDAARKIVWGATAWGGQWCTSPGYAYVHESIAERFVAECKRAMVELYGTDPMESPPSPLSPPAVRADFLTFTEAQAILAAQPSGIEAIKGDLQMHSMWSDGSASIEDMAAAALELNYEYIAITDHAKGLKIAGGIDEVQLRQQAVEIDIVNRSLETAGHKVRVLRSIELNLNPAGDGDMDPKALAHLDIVIGCFHSALQRKEDQTERYLMALRNPTIQILGHPRGRIYNYRSGLSADWPRVFALAAELDKAVEIDAYPDRQDLSPDLLALARDAGCRISFGTDSHGPSQLRFMAFAVASALQAGIARERVLNFMSREELLDWVREVRDASAETKGWV